MHHGPHVHFTYIFTYILVKKIFHWHSIYIYTHNWCACCLWKPSLSSSLVKGNFCSRGFACTDATEMLFLHRKHSDSKLCAISYSGLANFIYLQWKGIWSAVKKTSSWNQCRVETCFYDKGPTMTWPPHARCFQTRAASCLEIQQGRSLGAHGLMAHPTNGSSLPCHDLYIYMYMCKCMLLQR